MSLARQIVRSVTAGRTYLRVVFLLLGAAIFLGFALVDSGLSTLIIEWQRNIVGVGLAALVVVVPPLLLALVPGVRELEMFASGALLGTELGSPPAPARTWQQRWRTMGWVGLHLLAGAFVGTYLIVVVPTAVLLAVQPLRGVGPYSVVPGLTITMRGDIGDVWLLGVLGLVLVLAVLVITLLGNGFAWLAPRLLGPSATERLAAAEEQVATLVERNRLARELHDGVGHALSVVTLQSAAARAVLDQDPAYVAEALATIEDTARLAVQDLDHVLGLLREDERGRIPQPTLSDLEDMLRARRRSGLTIDGRVEFDHQSVPPVVSREAYRIVQEALTNAASHGTDDAAELSVRADDEQLRITVVNSVRPGAGRRGGRGLRGMRERASLLGGSVEAGPDREGRWRVDITLPIGRTEHS